jgi:hypothetical protein
MDANIFLVQRVLQRGDSGRAARAHLRERARRIACLRAFFQLLRLQMAHIMMFQTLRTRITVHSAALPHPLRASITNLLSCSDDSSWIAMCGFSSGVFLEIHAVFQEPFENEWDKYFLEVFDGEYNFNRDQALGRPGSLYNRTQRDCRRVLLLLLMFCTTTTPPKVFTSLFGASPSTINRYLRIGFRALLSALRALHSARVEWPNHMEQHGYANLIAQHHQDLPFAPFAFLDGLNLPVFESGDYFEQNRHYNGWLSGTFISNIFVYAPDGTIIYARVNCAGCQHDSWVATDLRHRILHDEGFLAPGLCLVADTAFPRFGAMLGKIVTPWKQTEIDTLNRHGASAEKLLEINYRHIRAIEVRQAAEWGMRQIEGCFARLDLNLTLHCGERLQFLQTIVHLHNLRVRRVGLSQIQTVYARNCQNFRDLLRSGRPQRVVAPALVL